MTTDAPAPAEARPTTGWAVAQLAGTPVFTAVLCGAYAGWWVAFVILLASASAYIAGILTQVWLDEQGDGE